MVDYYSQHLKKILLELIKDVKNIMAHFIPTFNLYSNFHNSYFPHSNYSLRDRRNFYELTLKFKNVSNFDIKLFLVFAL